MTKKLSVLVLVLGLTALQGRLVFAQIDTAVPTVSTPEPTSEPTPEPAPIIEEIVTPADTNGPSFVSIATVSAGETESSIVWTTDEMSTGHIEYGETSSYGQNTAETALALEHAQTITGLTPGTTYHYRIVSKDQSGNVSYSQNRTLETAVEAIAIDNVPPQITNIVLSNITTNAATIGWNTDELAQGRIEYGTSENYGSETTLTTDYTTEHALSLSNLSSDTVYHYRITVFDETGNEFVSPDETFRTDAVSAPALQPAFAIAHAETNAVSTSTATIIWNTNEPATSQVFYGQTEDFSQSSAVVSTLQTSHSVELQNLKPGTAYFFKVVSVNAADETISEAGFEFSTLYQETIIDSAPVISDVRVESVGTSTASIVWNTSEPAGGELLYGTTTAYTHTDGGHHVLLTAHRHVLANLAPGTTYNFQPIVWDEAGNESLYENLTFTTENLVSSVPASVSNASVVETPPLVQSLGGGHLISSASAGAIKTSPLDSQVLFLWDNQSTTSNIQTVIVKKAGDYPSNPFDGTLVYRGVSGTFTDSGLSNGMSYFYSVFRVDSVGNYSQPEKVSVTPEAGVAQTVLNIVPAVVQKTPVYTFNQTLKQGDNNNQVAHLQVLLASEPVLYPEGIITGYFGQLTTLALVRFQTKYGLQPTGIADMETLDTLQNLSKVEHVTDFASLHDYWQRDLVLGSRGYDVTLLQSYLADLGYYPEALVTGYFGPLTEKAVIAFQNGQAISPASGYFGALSQQRMSDLIKLQNVAF